MSCHRKHLSFLEFGLLNYVTWLVLREKKRRCLWDQAPPSGSHRTSGESGRRGKARREVERSPGEGGQLLGAAWGCECGALRQSFPIGEPNYDPH